MLGLYAAYKIGKRASRHNSRSYEMSPEDTLFLWTMAATLLFWPVALFAWLKNKPLPHIIHVASWTFILIGGWPAYFVVGFFAMCIFLIVQIWRSDI